MGNFIAKIAPNSALSTTFFPPTPSFLPSRDIPSLSGKVVIVTGGYAGIGYETAKQLLLKDAQVYVAGRSEQKAKEAIKKLMEETRKENVFFLKLDLADLRSVRDAADEFLRSNRRLDVLINSA